MTRYARASGKSGKRLPDEATSWTILKQQVVSNGDTEQNDAGDSRRETNTEELSSQPHDNSNQVGLDVCTSNNGPNKRKHKSENSENENKTKTMKFNNKKNFKSSEKNQRKGKKFQKGNKKNFSSEKAQEDGNKDLPEDNSTNKEDLPEDNSTNKDENSVMKDSKHQKKYKHFNNKRNKFNGRNTKRNKPVINKNTKVATFENYKVLPEDAERLTKLKKEMIAKGLPREEIKAALKTERRRAEKAFQRKFRKRCFRCSEFGHFLEECPKLDKTVLKKCFKCGSLEHSSNTCKSEEYKYADCFICSKTGHIARECPDNPRGVYINGGACLECGDVTHLKKECPELQKKKAEDAFTLGLIDRRNIESLNDEDDNKKNSKKNMVKKTKVVSF